MKDFDPPNEYRYEEIDYHGQPAIRIVNRYHKKLDFVYTGDITIEELRLTIEIMQEL